ncbi:MAG: hypothetical protein HFJ43_00010 [Clostridia bacterium]|nr:hypothetical protein [Clostridia bacterium]
MKKIKNFFKKIVIIYLVFFILLSNMSQCLARAYDDACGEYVSDYAKKFIEQYGGDSTYYLSQEIAWGGGSFGNGTFKSCCTSGVKYMYEMALGINIYDYGYSALSDNNLSITSQYWDKIPTSEAKPGDILVKAGHVEMSVSNGANDHADFGSTGKSSAVMHYNARDSFTIAIRMKNNVDVNPNGKITGSSSTSNYDEERDSIYGSNGFIYQGVATLSGYESGGTLGKWLFDTLLKILDWVIGILTYLIRIVIVGWTVIVERVFIDGIVNAVTGIENTKESEEDDENNEEEEKLEDIGDEQNSEEYIGTGVQEVASVGSSTKITTSSKANVTVENIVFNRVPILDINFFNFETALTVKRNEGNIFRPGTLIGNAGKGVEVVEAQIDKNGIIYILKTAIAMWYYTFRVMAIAVMLIILIYLGIRMAFSTIADGKTVYKEMIIGWVTGLILLFVMHYIIYAAIIVNEGLVKIIAGTQVNLGGDEISLYETVRSKAYEIKASTGWSGTIMYMVLVYYSVRFLLIYLKRYFTVALLAILSPLVALMYAFEKINKKGKKAAIYSMWLKDLISIVLLQSEHALIYVVFVVIPLKLTGTSLVGIALALAFLSFMLPDADNIMRKIMAFTEGPSSLMSEKMPNIAKMQIAGMSMKKIGKVYNKTIIRPARNFVGAGISHATDRFREFRESLRPLTEEQRQNEQNLADIEKKKIEKEKEVKTRTKEEIQRALGVAGSAAAGAIQTLAGVAGTVIDLEAGTVLLGRGMSSFIDASDKLREIRGPKHLRPGASKRYTFNGVRLADKRTAEQLMLNLRRDNINYTIDASGRIKAGNTLREHRRYINKYVKSNSNLLTKGLKFATGAGLIEKLAIPANEIDVRDRALIRLYDKARDRENELVREYKFARKKQDELIASIAEKNPDLAAKLQAKQNAEMENAMLTLLEPIPMEDIEEAISKYESKGGKIDFGENQDISELDVEQKIQGISNELNTILEQKKSKVRVGESFTNRLKARLEKIEEQSDRNINKSKAKNRRRSKMQDEIDRNDPNSSEYAPRQLGKDIDKMTNPDLSVDDNTLDTERKTSRTKPIRMKLETDNDDLTKNGVQKSESLKESIYKTTKAVEAVEIDSDIRVENLKPIMLKLIELQNLNEEAEALGQDPLYNIEEIVKMLKDT